jgi:hypothetical protein
VSAIRVSFRIALQAVARQRLRSLLTSVGILIGIAAVVLVSARKRARAEIGKQIEHGIERDLRVLSPFEQAEFAPRTMASPIETPPQFAEKRPRSAWLPCIPRPRLSW